MDIHHFGYDKDLIEREKRAERTEGEVHALIPKKDSVCGGIVEGISLHAFKMIQPGTIQVVEGPMGSGKSTYLIRYVETHGRHLPVLFINHSTDNRDGDDMPVSSRSLLVSSDTIRKLNATYLKVSKLSEVDPKVLEKHSTVIIDEAQFFPDLVEEVTKYAEELGKTVIAAGLLSDYNRKPFGQLLDLMRLADSHVTLEGLCDDCLLDGRKTKSQFTRALVKMAQQKVIGKDIFRGCCRACWLKYGGEP